MLTLPPCVHIFLCAEQVDLRLGHDGLAARVRQHWDEALFDGHLFVFLGKRLDRCKILFFDGSGWCVLAKRLDAGSFQLPRLRGSDSKIAIDGDIFASLLAGLDFTVARRGWFCQTGT